MEIDFNWIMWFFGRVICWWYTNWLESKFIFKALFGQLINYWLVSIFNVCWARFLRRNFFFEIFHFSVHLESHCKKDLHTKLMIEISIQTIKIRHICHVFPPNQTSQKVTFSNSHGKLSSMISIKFLKTHKIFTDVSNLTIFKSLLFKT